MLVANCVQIKTVMKKQTRTENCICSAHRNIALHCTARYSIRKYFLLYNNVSIFYILFWRNKEKRLDECIIILHCVFSYRYFVCKCKLRWKCKKKNQHKYTQALAYAQMHRFKFYADSWNRSMRWPKIIREIIYINQRKSNGINRNYALHLEEEKIRRETSHWNRIIELWHFSFR